MKKIKITHKHNPIGWEERLPGLDAQAWVDQMIQAQAFGKPEHWVLHKDEPMAEAYDDADVLEEETRQDIDGAEQKWVKLKSEYTIEIEDITAQVAQETTNIEALSYLASTDWYIIREIDQGTPCPGEIKQLRAEARSKIVR